MKMQANYITYQSSDSIVMLGFADEEFDASQYVILQKEVMPSRQDRDLGMDRPYIEINSQACSGYGIVRTAQLKVSQLVIMLDVQSASRLSVDESIIIDHKSPPAILRDVITYLRLILGNDTLQINFNF